MVSALSLRLMVGPMIMDETKLATDSEYNPPPADGGGIFNELYGAPWCSGQHTPFRICKSWVRIPEPLIFTS